MDPNSSVHQPKTENQYNDPDSLYDDMLEKLPPLESLPDTEDLKLNAGLHYQFQFQFQFNGFEDFFENMQVTQEPYVSNDCPLANDCLSSNERRPSENRTRPKIKRFKKKRQDKLELSEIRNFFDRPIMKAAKELNVGLTVLKKRCRELGIYRWPHRKLKSLNSLISNLKSVGMDDEVKNLEEHMVLIEQEPDAELTDGTKKLRQACFKANYKKRKSLALCDYAYY